MRRWAVPLAGLLFMVAAATSLAIWLIPTARPGFALRQVDIAALSGWSDDDHNAAMQAFLAGCRGLSPFASQATLAPRGARLDGRLLKATCDSAIERTAAGQGAREILESLFSAYQVSGSQGTKGLFTGYFEPVFEARRQPDDRFAYPLLARPADLLDVDLGLFRADLAGVTISGRADDQRLVPYARRAEIEDGALSGRGLEIAWLSDPFEAFLIHIQGSARLVFADGSSQRIGFAGQNGHGYTSIGRLLVERGELSLDEVSVEAIGEWIESHPRQGKELLRENARYIFFRQLDGTAAPVGALGVELTAGRSMAVDPAYLPLGLPVWVETTVPAADNPAGATVRFRRLMVAQDTGAAIRGPVRGDIYWGSGEAAGDIAGHMRGRGKHYLLLPKAASVESGS